MTRDQALAKIKKCLALGRSAEPHEAAAGMRQAQKLMAEFDLSAFDLSLADVQEVQIKASSTGSTLWESYLAREVSVAFACERYVTRRGTFNAGNYRSQLFYVFVGVDAAAEIAGYAFEVLSRQCSRARADHIRQQPRNCKAITKTARGDHFAKGWVMAASAVVEQFARDDKRETLLLQYMAAKHPAMQTITPRDTTQGRKLTDGHLSAGFRAGSNARISHAVGGRTGQALIA